MRTGRLLFPVLLCIALCGSAIAARGAHDKDRETAKGGPDIKKLVLGNHVCGPELKASSLINHVVVVLFWNINSGDSLTDLATLDNWQKEYAEQGLVAIGIHPYKFSDAAIEGTCKDKGVTYPIYCEGKMIGQDVRAGTILVFDHTGMIVPINDQKKATDAVKEAVTKMPANIVGNRDFEKLGFIADALSKGTDPPKVLKVVLSKMKSDDKQTAEEAQYLFDRLQKWAASRVELITAQKMAEPLQTRDKLEELLKELKGCDLEKIVLVAKTALDQDKDYQAELAAWLALEKIQELDKKIKPSKRAERFKKENATVLKQMKDAIEQMQKTWEKSKATLDAVAIGNKYGLIEKDKKK
ncbi:MAG TPA: hypothetical protein VM186_14465 [Planctomycetota bacterium]|nr:hypothetical protein [Planctomycetota bacterium]